MYKPFSQMVELSGSGTFVESVPKWLKPFGLLTVTLDIKNIYQKAH